MQRKCEFEGWTLFEGMGEVGCKEMRGGVGDGVGGVGDGGDW